MAALFNFEVHTPYRRFYDGKAQVITLSLSDGEIGVYARHSPFIAVTATGILRIKDPAGKWLSAFVSGGILEVKEYKNVLLVNAAEWPEEINRERALADKKRAEENLSKQISEYEIEREKDDINRANFRLKVLELQNSA